jgi:hypothetical protein
MRTIVILPKSDNLHVFDVETTARWLIRQAGRGDPCGVSDLKVMKRTAELIIERKERIAFKTEKQTLPPNLVLGLIRKGRDPRPE